MLLFAMSESQMKFSEKYELLKEYYVKEHHAEGYLLTHKKSGAEILVLKNNDNNKVFGVSFKTLVNSHNGVAHILEHAVLNGSRKYKAKEPFVELIKTSVNTYVNASTSLDKTVYPVASQNEQDLSNLMDVYMDAVFFPLLDKKVFLQEGWHYEYDKENKFIAKGVVYNEMKGYVTSADDCLMNAINRTLYPDTIYKYETGGYPENILDLTYEEFCDFHKKYYHPSNAKFLIYGNGDIEKHLNHVDEFLKEFDKKELNFEIKSQKKFSETKRVTEKYPIGKEIDATNKFFFSKTWAFSSDQSSEEILALDILEYIFLHSDASPFKKQILESDLAEDLYGGLDTYKYQKSFLLIAKNTREKDIKEIENIVDNLLEKLAKEIDKDLLESAINVTEFNLREYKVSGYPKGIALFYQSLTSWNYDKDPIDAIRYESEFVSIRERLQKGEKYFENLIKKNFIENTHCTVVDLIPDNNLLPEREQKEKDFLSLTEKNLTEEERKEILKISERLQEWQNSKDTPEALAQIPKLEISDLDKKISKLPINIEKKGDVEIVTHDIDTNEILYINFGFDLKNLPQSLYQYLQIYEDCFLRMGTHSYSADELALWIDKKIGSLDTEILLKNKIKDRNDLIMKFFINAALLRSSIKDLTEILSTKLFEINFSDKSKLLSILQEQKSSYEERFLGNSAVSIAALRATSGLNLLSNYKEKISGLEYYFFLKKLIENFDSEFENIITNLNKLHSEIVNKKNLVLNITSSQEVIDEMMPMILGFVETIDSKDSKENQIKFAPNNISEAFLVPSEVNFNAYAVNLYNLIEELPGYLMTIQNLLYGNYFWNKIRVLGGAYGGSSTFNLESGNLVMYSYSDPNIRNTFDVFENVSKYLLEGEFTKYEIEGAILATIGDLDKFLYPDDKGWVSLVNYLTGNTDERLQKQRDDVLNLSLNDLRELGETLQKISEYSKVVLGNKSKIEEFNESGKGAFDVKTLI